MHIAALLQLCLQHFTSMHAGSYVMEDNQTGGGGKWSESPHIIQCILLHKLDEAYVHNNNIIIIML